MGLEEALREAVARGITHLSLHPVPSEDNKTTYWRCSATPSTVHKYVSVTSLDPIEAITQTLQAMPKAGKRKAPEQRETFEIPPGTEAVRDDEGRATGELTAAVIEPGRSTPAFDTTQDEWSRFK